MTYRQRTGVTTVMRSARTDDPDFLRVLVERVVQAVLEAEMTARLHAEPDERSTKRTGYRNGYKPRTLNSRGGTPRLRVPRDREGPFSTQLFARLSAQREGARTGAHGDVRRGRLDPESPRDHRGLVRHQFLQEPGLRVGGTARRCTEGVAASRADRDDLSVSERRCPLRARASGRADRQPRGAHRRGLGADAHREILAVAVADSESEATYQQLVRDLRARGLSGVRLAASDDHRGLKAAIDRHFQGARWNRCPVYFTRELIKIVGAGRRAALAADLREISAATTREQAVATAAVAARWESSHPVAARVLEGGLRTAWPVSPSRWRTASASAARTAWSGSTKKSGGAHEWRATFPTLRHACGW